MGIGKEIDYLASALVQLDDVEKSEEQLNVIRLIWKAIETFAKEVTEGNDT